LLALLGPTPSAAQADAVAYHAWLDAVFDPWLRERQQQVADTLWILQQVVKGSPGEAIPALLLSGLVVERFRRHMTSVPPPPEVQADAKLARIYQNSLNELVSPFVRDASVAYRQCTELASVGRELAFGPWLALCQERQTAIDAQLKYIQEFGQAVAAEREADRLALEGPRPPGPELCWAPHMGRQGPATPAAASKAAAGDGQPGATGAGVEPEPDPNAERCALAVARKDVEVPATSIPTPRDLRYGVRQPETGVRVSALVDDNPTMDGGPLAAPATQAELGRCFATAVPAAKAITVALHASLSVDALGHVQSVDLTPEPSDAAVPPSKALLRCVAQALKGVPFGCSASAQPTQAHASYCLRRD
jgi:hypothetical protein